MNMVEQQSPNQANQQPPPNQPVQAAQSSDKDKKEATPYENISTSVTGAGSRLKVLEERYGNLRKKTLIPVIMFFLFNLQFTVQSIVLAN